MSHSEDLYRTKRKSLIQKMDLLYKEDDRSAPGNADREQTTSQILLQEVEKNVFIKCTNCGKIGHTHKKCPSPILSYGIIIAKKEEEDEDIKFLLIQRKNSIGFIDFIKFKYNPNNIVFLGKLFTDMAPYEKNDLLNLSFSDLYKKSLASPMKRINTKDYEKAKAQFEYIQKGYMVDDEFISIKTLIDSNPSYKSTLEWGFPKGKRRRGNEEDMQCAIREFEEESNYKSSDYTLINFPRNAFWELYRGTNDYYYLYIYYVAFLKRGKPAYIDPKNICQVGEIGDIKWVTFDQAKMLLDDHHPERVKILNTYRDFILSHMTRFKTAKYYFTSDTRYKSWSDQPFSHPFTWTAHQ